MTRTITGTLLIPTSEVREDGFYTDLTLQLVFITAGEKLDVSYVAIN